MRRFRLLLLVLFTSQVMAVTDDFINGNGLTIIPADPTQQDAIRIRIDTAGCFVENDIPTRLSIQNAVITFVVPMIEADICFTPPPAATFTFTMGRIPAGDYQLQIHRQFSAGPADTQQIYNVPLGVSGALSIPATSSWSLLIMTLILSGLALSTLRRKA